MTNKDRAVANAFRIMRPIDGEKCWQWRADVEGVANQLERVNNSARKPFSKAEFLKLAGVK